MSERRFYTTNTIEASYTEKGELLIAQFDDYGELDGVVLLTKNDLSAIYNGFLLMEEGEYPDPYVQWDEQQALEG